MTQPTAEAYEAALDAYDRVPWTKHRDAFITGVLRAATDAVWPLAVAEGRRLEAERLAPLVEAAEALTAAIGATLPPDMNLSDPALGLILGKEERAFLAAVDALTREDTEG